MASAFVRVIVRVRVREGAKGDEICPQWCFHTNSFLDGKLNEIKKVHSVFAMVVPFVVKSKFK